MVKLYKHRDGALHYQEAWTGEGLLYHHWGVVGEKGEHLTRPLKFFERKAKAVQSVLLEARRQGYKAIALDDHEILLIEYAVDGFGTDDDLSKRHALQDRMDDVLGWSGLGHCDGGSSGSGTMEVCCYVVDFDIAKAVVAADLKGTEFGDFTRIYREDAE